MEDYWAPIRAWLREDETLADWLDTDDEATNLATLSTATLKDFAAILTYKGFNTDDKKINISTHKKINFKRIVRIIFTAHNSWMTTNATVADVFKMTYTAPDGTTHTIEHPKRASLARDIHFIILLFMKGSSLEKFWSQSRVEIQRILEHLKVKLKLDTTKRNPECADTVTVARIVSCFPMVACKVFHNGEGKTPVSRAQIGLDTTISRSVVCPYFPSIIFKDWVDVTNNINLLFFLVQVLNDDLLHEADKHYTTLSEMFDNYKASYNSPTTLAKSKKSFAQKVAITNVAADGYCTQLMNATQVAEASIRSRRPDDPKLDEVINKLKALKTGNE